MSRSISLTRIGCILVILLAAGSSFRYPASSKKPTTALLKYIYLTFDDGPLDGSEYIDSVVLAEKLKISVFLVGENIKNSSKLKNYYQLYEQNPFIEAYNHSYSHANGKYKEYYSEPQKVVQDIRQNETDLRLRFKIVRLPGRNTWRVGSRKKDDPAGGAAAADLLAQQGYKLFGWDIEWQHHANDGTPVQSVDEMYKAIVEKLENGSTFTSDHIVILLHDEMFRKKWEESELKQLIDKLRTHDNYVFEHIRYYPAAN